VLDSPAPGVIGNRRDQMLKSGNLGKQFSASAVLALNPAMPVRSCLVESREYFSDRTAMLRLYCGDELSAF
jgi:hypothetical protein